MTTAALTSEGRITVPVAVLRALGVDAGDRVEFVEMARPGRHELIAAIRPVTQLEGKFGSARRKVSIDQMNAVIARHGATGR